jgi:hypothetical protein
VLHNAGLNGHESLIYGLTLGETRFNPLTQLNTTNIDQLGSCGHMTLAREAGRKALHGSGVTRSIRSVTMRRSGLRMMAGDSMRIGPL